MEKVNNLVKTCILEGIGSDKPSLESEPCLSCIKDCYRPKNMEAEKQEAYMNGCKSINTYGSQGS